MLQQARDSARRRLGRWLRPAANGPVWGGLAAFLLVAILLAAFFLRLAFARGASLYIDEYTTLLAAKYTAQFGVPITPSGVYYTPGLPFTYLEAAVLALAPFDSVLARLPSVLLGTGTVLALFLVGRRLFGAPAAFLAATWLALDPEAIIWDGRARMYALLHLLIVLSVYCFVVGVVEERRDRARHLFVLLFLAALLTQMEAALLLPALGLVWLLWQKPRDWLRPAVWLDLGLLAVGLVVRFLLHQLMILPGSGAPGQPRPFVALGGDVLAGLQALSPFFFAPSRRLATALFGLGLSGLAVQLFRHGWAYLRRERAHVASLSIFLLVVWTEMALVVGESWRRPRYLLLVLPWFFLVAASHADGMLRAAWGWCQRQWPGLRSGRLAEVGAQALMIPAVIAVAAWGTPWAVLATRYEDYGYDLAFKSVRQQWLPGDAVATIVPSASLLYLDRCDYLAIENGFEGYTQERNGREVEGWGLVPLLQSPAELEVALAAHPRLWFVVDTMRFERNFSPGFRALVWQRMIPQSYQRGVLVFRSDPELMSPNVSHASQVDFGGLVTLVRTDLETTRLQPGDSLRLAFHWQALVPLVQEYSIFVHVDNAERQTVALADGAPTGGLFPMVDWEPGDLIVDQRVVDLPSDLSPGTYRLNVGVYQPETGERLPVISEGDPAENQATVAFIWVGEQPVNPPPSHPVAASFDRQICLQGFDLETASGGTTVVAGEELWLTLHWGACGRVESDYHAFVHLTGEDGQILAQGDAPPLEGAIPTTFWPPGEVHLDSYLVGIPADAPPGPYTLQIGLYMLATGERLPLVEGGDALILTMLEVQQ